VEELEFSTVRTDAVMRLAMDASPPRDHSEDREIELSNEVSVLRVRLDERYETVQSAIRTLRMDMEGQLAMLETSQVESGYDSPVDSHEEAATVLRENMRESELRNSMTATVQDLEKKMDTELRNSTTATQYNEAIVELKAEVSRLTANIAENESGWREDLIRFKQEQDAKFSQMSDTAKPSVKGANEVSSEMELSDSTYKMLQEKLHEIVIENMHQLRRGSHLEGSVSQSQEFSSPITDLGFISPEGRQGIPDLGTRIPDSVEERLKEKLEDVEMRLTVSQNTLKQAVEAMAQRHEGILNTVGLVRAQMGTWVENITMALAEETGDVGKRRQAIQDLEKKMEEVALRLKAAETSMEQSAATLLKPPSPSLMAAKASSMELQDQMMNTVASLSDDVSDAKESISMVEAQLSRQMELFRIDLVEVNNHREHKDSTDVLQMVQDLEKKMEKMESRRDMVQDLEKKMESQRDMVQDLEKKMAKMESQRDTDVSERESLKEKIWEVKKQSEINAEINSVHMRASDTRVSDIASRTQQSEGGTWEAKMRYEAEIVQDLEKKMEKMRYEAEISLSQELKTRFKEESLVHSESSQSQLLNEISKRVDANELATQEARRSVSKLENTLESMKTSIDGFEAADPDDVESSFQNLEGRLEAMEANLLAQESILTMSSPGRQVFHSIERDMSPFADRQEELMEMLTDGQKGVESLFESLSEAFEEHKTQQQVAVSDIKNQLAVEEAHAREWATKVAGVQDLLESKMLLNGQQMANIESRHEGLQSDLNKLHVTFKIEEERRHEFRQNEENARRGLEERMSSRLESRVSGFAYSDAVKSTTGALDVSLSSLAGSQIDLSEELKSLKADASLRLNEQNIIETKVDANEDWRIKLLQMVQDLEKKMEKMENEDWRIKLDRRIEDIIHKVETQWREHQRVAVTAAAAVDTVSLEKKFSEYASLDAMKVLNMEINNVKIKLDSEQTASSKAEKHMRKNEERLEKTISVTKERLSQIEGHNIGEREAMKGTIAALVTKMNEFGLALQTHGMPPQEVSRLQGASPRDMDEMKTLLDPNPNPNPNPNWRYG